MSRETEQAESRGVGVGKKVDEEREQMGWPTGLPAATGQKREGEFFLLFLFHSQTEFKYESNQI